MTSNTKVEEILPKAHVDLLGVQVLPLVHQVLRLLPFSRVGKPAGGRRGGRGRRRDPRVRLVGRLQVARLHRPAAVEVVVADADGADARGLGTVVGRVVEPLDADASPLASDAASPPGRGLLLKLHFDFIERKIGNAFSYFLMDGR